MVSVSSTGEQAALLQSRAEQADCYTAVALATIAACTARITAVITKMHYALAGEGIRNVSPDKDLFLPTFFPHVQADGSRQRQAQSRFLHSDARRSGCPSFDRKSTRVSASRSRRHHRFGRGRKKGPFGEESETPLVHAFYRLGQLSLPFLLVRFFARSSFCGTATH